jgi:hypothetical protein
MKLLPVLDKVYVKHKSVLSLDFSVTPHYMYVNILKSSTPKHFEYSILTPVSVLPFNTYMFVWVLKAGFLYLFIFQY